MDYETNFRMLHLTLVIVNIIVAGDLLLSVLDSGVAGMRPVHVAVIFLSSLMIIKVTPI